MKHIDPAAHDEAGNYKILSNIVVPRPIAWITSQNEQGVVNLAPFSFFNAIGSEPLFLMTSIADKDDGSRKDTARNILARREYVVNLVTWELLGAMNLCAAEFPPGESELTAAGLHPAESQKIKVPRIAEARASMECVLHSHQPVGNYTLFIGQVVMFNIADQLLGEGLRVNDFFPVGRMGSPSFYCQTTSRFEVPRIKYVDWKSGSAQP